MITSTQITNNKILHSGLFKLLISLDVNFSLEIEKTVEGVKK